MQTFTKRPTPVEAAQWDGTPADADRIIAWIRANGGTARHTFAGNVPAIAIDTPTSRIYAAANNYVVRSGPGLFYRLDHHAFHARYQPTTPEETTP